uniref:Uncharacterized protein n=1 Tax=Vespula pensylvanica TaxID=30213 RepID=A0A834UFI2_VESPE|nr:hypothetical protein H0235_003994 [Vespula pensylvanica]
MEVSLVKIQENRPEKLRGTRPEHFRINIWYPGNGRIHMLEPGSIVLRIIRLERQATDFPTCPQFPSPKDELL